MNSSRHARPAGSVRVWRAGIALALWAAAAAGAAEPLRVCADPDNMPFSRIEGSPRGLYVDVAEWVAERLQRPVQFEWAPTFNQRRALRGGLLEKRCDVWFGLPANADYEVRGIVRSRPFVTVSYAVLTDPARPAQSLRDLRDRRVAVEHGSAAQLVLAGAGFAHLVTSVNAAQAIASMNRGDADAAVLWGPNAGWALRSTEADRWRLQPLLEEPFAAPMAAAVRRGDEPLLAQVQEALDGLRTAIEDRARVYGFPAGAGLPSVAAVSDAPRMLKVADTAVTPQADAAAGRVRFNSTCSHCHSTDGASPMRERDLRRLSARYDARWRESAATTILNGRSDLGMPVWKDALSTQELADIVAFLETIQR